MRIRSGPYLWAFGAFDVDLEVSRVSRRKLQPKSCATEPLQQTACAKFAMSGGRISPVAAFSVTGHGQPRFSLSQSQTAPKRLKHLVPVRPYVCLDRVTRRSGLPVRVKAQPRHRTSWKRLLAVVLPFSTLLFGRYTWARGLSRGGAKAGMVAAKLSTTQLLLASGIVGATGSLTLWLRGLSDLAEAMLWSCLRCALQLYLLGGLILNWLFGTRQPGIVLAWVLGVGLLAAQQAGSQETATSTKTLRLRLIS